MPSSYMLWNFPWNWSPRLVLKPARCTTARTECLPSASAAVEAGASLAFYSCARRSIGKTYHPASGIESGSVARNAAAAIWSASTAILKFESYRLLCEPHPEERRVAMRLEGWPRATTVQAAILRDASRRPKGEGLLLRMRAESVETIAFMESVLQLKVPLGNSKSSIRSVGSTTCPARSACRGKAESRILHQLVEWIVRFLDTPW